MSSWNGTNIYYLSDWYFFSSVGRMLMFLAEAERRRLSLNLTQSPFFEICKFNSIQNQDSILIVIKHLFGSIHSYQLHY